MTSFLSGTRRRIRSLHADLRRARLCGSYPGGWVAAALGSCGGHVLAKLFSETRRVRFPHRMRLAARRFSSVTPVILRAVALSAAPDSGRCLAAAVVSGSSNVAFCRPGLDLHWTACSPEEITELHDMVYYDEGEFMKGFHVLGENGEVGVFPVANYSGGTSIKVRATYYEMPRLVSDYTLLSRLPSSTSITRYLVVSRQRLLMVVRFFREDEATGVCRTLMFRVFQMRVMELLPQGRHMASWVELNGLDGRVLFVARGCSRAYEASELHGFAEGSIYFVDDGKFDVLLALSNASDYPCRDVGTYSMSAAAIARPSLGAPAADMPAPFYGTKTYLCLVDEQDKEVLVEMREGEALPSGSIILGTRWNFPSDEPLSKFSPPIWVAP